MNEESNPIVIVAVVISVIVVAILLMNAHSRRKLTSLRARGIYPEAGKETDADVVRLIQEREKILAIRCYRAIHGGGLKDAKEAVERMEQGMK
jgi:ribosomal protein L7/L12